MSFIKKIICKSALLSICVALCISGKAYAAVVHVFEQTSAGGSITQLSDTTLDTGAIYNTQEAPRIDGFIFTHWSIAQNQEITDRDEWGRSLDSASYMLYEETTLTANYLAESVDTDSDGVADGYELYWYGDLDEALLSDTDKDGYTFAQEIAYGSNPLFPDAHGFGVVSYKESDLLWYNPNRYAPYIIRSEPEGELFATIKEYAAPGDNVTTASYAPNISNFAYWTVNGVRQEDAWGVALNSANFVATDKEITEVVAVCEEDELSRMAKYYYGKSASADSDTDKDGYTFAQEIAYGSNPLFPDIHGFGVVFYEDSDLLLYNPNRYAPYIIRSEPEGELFATIEDYAAPGEVITTEPYDPNTSNFAYWTKNGVRQEDAWGVALNSVSFVATDKEITEVVAALDGDEVARFAQYYYGKATASNSDSDGDGYTFEQEIAYGTNPLFPNEHGFGVIFYDDSDIFELNIQPYEQLTSMLVDGKAEDFFYSPIVGNETSTPYFGENASPTVIDLNGDGLFDFVVAVSGGLHVYVNKGALGSPDFTEVNSLPSLNAFEATMKSITNPVIASDKTGIYLAGTPIRYFALDGEAFECNISGIAMDSYDGMLYVLSQDGAVYVGKEDEFIAVAMDSAIINGVSLSIADVSNDGVADMLATDVDGRIWYYIGNGDGSFTLQHKVWAGSYDGFAENLKLDAVDWDDDGDIDAIAGTANGKLMLLRDPRIGRPSNVQMYAGLNSVQLTWDPNKQSRVRGYRVYRSEEETAAYTSLIKPYTMLPTYRDVPNVIKDYFYKVSSVSRFYTAGNSTPTEMESITTSPIKATLGGVDVSIIGGNVLAGEIVSVLVSVNNSMGLSARNIGLSLSYDANVLKPVSVEKTGLTEAMSIVDDKAHSGIWSLSGTSSEPLIPVGAGKIFAFNFEAICSTNAQTQVAIASASLVAESGQSAIARLGAPAQVVIIEHDFANSTPQVTVSQTADISVEEGKTFNVDLTLKTDTMLEGKSLVIDVLFDSALFTPSKIEGDNIIGSVSNGVWTLSGIGGSIPVGENSLATLVFTVNEVESSKTTTIAMTNAVVSSFIKEADILLNPHTIVTTIINSSVLDEVEGEVVPDEPDEIYPDNGYTQATFGITSGRVEVGEQVDLSLYMFNYWSVVNGKDMNIVISYDPIVLKPVNVRNQYRGFSVTWSADDGFISITGKTGTFPTSTINKNLLKITFEACEQSESKYTTVNIDSVVAYSRDNKKVILQQKIPGVIKVDFVLPPTDESQDIVAPYFRGDVNGDARLSKEDLQLMARMMNGGQQNDKPNQNHSPTAQQLNAGDYNGDGRLTQNDYQLMKKHFRELGIK